MNERPDYFHDSPEVCVNKLFNMIQKCRTEISIMQAKPEFNSIKDSDIIKCADALAKDVRSVFGMK